MKNMQEIMILNAEIMKPTIINLPRECSVFGSITRRQYTNSPNLENISSTSSSPESYERFLKVKIAFIFYEVNYNLAL